MSCETCEHFVADENLCYADKDSPKETLPDMTCFMDTTETEKES